MARTNSKAADFKIGYLLQRVEEIYVRKQGAIHDLFKPSMPDITARARNIFKLVNGVPTAFEADGAPVRVGQDGVKPMIVDDSANCWKPSLGRAISPVCWILFSVPPCRPTPARSDSRKSAATISRACRIRRAPSAIT